MAAEVSATAISAPHGVASKVPAGLLARASLLALASLLVVSLTGGCECQPEQPFRLLLIR